QVCEQPANAERTHAQQDGVFRGIVRDAPTIMGAAVRLSSRLLHSSRRASAWCAIRLAGTLRLARPSAFKAAARRGRALVLIYHRIGERPSHVVPVITPDVLAEQLDALASVADLVPLGALTEPRRGDRLRVALTFDDDDPAHVEIALPILTRAGVPATFFLS